MDNAMFFPDTFEEFVKWYGFVDSGEHYTNGSELIQVYRVKQWLEHEFNRQQAEIERLRKANGLLEYVTKAVHHVKIGGEDWMIDFKTKEAMFEEINKKIDTLCNIQTSRAEAIKEFAEAVKMANTSKLTWFNEDIDNLVKEMVGDADV